MGEEKEVIILAEEHPTNIRTLAFFGLNSARDEIERFSKELINVLIKSYRRKKEEIYRYLKGIEYAVETINSSIDLYIKQQDIKLKELEILDHLISRLPEGSTKLYVEGSSGVLEERPEIDYLVKKYGIEVAFLDEGNPRYEKLEDESGNLLKDSSEIQIGREDYWVTKINTTIGGCKYAIVIVGRNHLRFSDKFIYKTSRNTPKYVGYFGVKLERNNYRVEIIDIPRLLLMDSKA
jgi:hypothetical protein